MNPQVTHGALCCLAVYLIMVGDLARRHHTIHLNSTLSTGVGDLQVFITDSSVYFRRALWIKLR